MLRCVGSDCFAVKTPSSPSEVCSQMSHHKSARLITTSDRSDGGGRCGGATTGSATHGLTLRLLAQSLILLMWLVAPRTAWADGGCASCIESAGCAWVCAITFAALCIPPWVGLGALAALLSRRFRRIKPHLAALGAAFVAPWLTTPLNQGAVWLFGGIALALIGTYLAFAYDRAGRNKRSKRGDASTDASTVDERA